MNVSTTVSTRWEIMRRSVKYTRDTVNVRTPLREGKSNPFFLTFATASRGASNRMLKNERREPLARISSTPSSTTHPLTRSRLLVAFGRQSCRWRTLRIALYYGSFLFEQPWFQSFCWIGICRGNPEASVLNHIFSSPSLYNGVRLLALVDRPIHDTVSLNSIFRCLYF